MYYRVKNENTNGFFKIEKGFVMLHVQKRYYFEGDCYWVLLVGGGTELLLVDKHTDVVSRIWNIMPKEDQEDYIFIPKLKLIVRKDYVERVEVIKEAKTRKKNSFNPFKKTEVLPIRYGLSLRVDGRIKEVSNIFASSEQEAEDLMERILEVLKERESLNENKL